MTAANQPPALPASEVQAFLADLIAVYRKHGLAISHDTGSFIVKKLEPYYVTWLSEAFDGRDSEGG